MKEQVLYCDRCGKRILLRPDDNTIFPMPWKIKEKHVIHNIWFQKYSKKEELDFLHDLCNDCMDEFRRWWANGKRN